MRKLTVFNLVTVDGYFSGRDGDISWHNVDEEFNDFAFALPTETSNSSIPLSCAQALTRTLRDMPEYFLALSRRFRIALSSHS